MEALGLPQDVPLGPEADAAPSGPEFELEEAFDEADRECLHDLQHLLGQYDNHEGIQTADDLQQDLGHDVSSGEESVSAPSLHI